MILRRSRLLIALWRIFSRAGPCSFHLRTNYNKSKTLRLCPMMRTPTDKIRKSAHRTNPSQPTSPNYTMTKLIWLFPMDSLWPRLINSNCNSVSFCLSIYNYCSFIRMDSGWTCSLPRSRKSLSTFLWSLWKGNCYPKYMRQWRVSPGPLSWW